MHDNVSDVIVQMGGRRGGVNRTGHAQRDDAMLNAEARDLVARGVPEDERRLGPRRATAPPRGGRDPLRRSSTGLNTPAGRMLVRAQALHEVSRRFR